MQFQFSFGEDFLRLHAGQIVSDQNYAVIELVANCWDAGATKVYIEWPESGGRLAFTDNGIGMTKEELLYRWGKFNYNRIIEQGGKDAVFPKGVSHNNRRVFGRNGVGRHAMFCFCEEYEVKTYKANEFTHIRVAQLKNGERPYDVELIETGKCDNGKFGTEIFTSIDNELIKLLEANRLIELIGSRFISDPQFLVHVNGNIVRMTDLNNITETLVLDYGGKMIQIKRILGDKGKNTKQNGIAWWFNGRLIGVPTWGTNETQIIDGRHPIAKRLLYIVIADALDQKVVKKDWSGFYATQETIDFQRAIFDFIRQDLSNLLHETRKERRLQVYNANGQLLRNLTSASKELISNFLEELQDKCPTIGIPELETAVNVLAKMENARSGFSLLEKIAKFQPSEIDSLNHVLDQWSVDDAKKVLGELHWRLELVEQLEKFLDDPMADELHDLQPLFEHGLWIFGPEFESIEFISNRSLSSVIKELIGDKVENANRKRPDFVALENSSIGIYTCENFNENHEPNDFAKVIIIELKRVGVPIDSEQKDQALNYARQLKKSKKVGVGTPIIAYVLGSEVEPHAIDTFIEGSISIIPCRYNIVLRKAHSRTFNLIKKIEQIKSITYNTEIDDLLVSEQGQLFD